MAGSPCHLRSSFCNWPWGLSSLQPASQQPGYFQQVCVVAPNLPDAFRSMGGSPMNTLQTIATPSPVKAGRVSARNRNREAQGAAVVRGCCLEAVSPTSCHRHRWSSLEQDRPFLRVCPRLLQAEGVDSTSKDQRVGAAWGGLHREPAAHICQHHPANTQTGLRSLLCSAASLTIPLLSPDRANQSSPRHALSPH